MGSRRGLRATEETLVSFPCSVKTNDPKPSRLPLSRDSRWWEEAQPLHQFVLGVDLPLLLAMPSGCNTPSSASSALMGHYLEKEFSLVVVLVLLPGSYWDMRTNREQSLAGLQVLHLEPGSLGTTQFPTACHTWFAVQIPALAILKLYLSWTFRDCLVPEIVNIYWMTVLLL